ncbi:synaptic vesicle 2-related protein-like [Pollicipes pollicipes]|uniref:synaptic vesicle 2-related protein-like n=1 Tax=Pollicipes pollicipes TaxID=41117 RepID=UPI00188550E1|nr:synaptic vesicle 2-related protein-like [Pollicipes pollicipes]
MSDEVKGNITRELDQHNLRWCLTFCYYGVALVSTELFKLPDAELCGSIGVDQEGQVCQASCQMLSQEDYLGLLWTTLSEIPGVLLAMFVIEKVGRKRTIAYGLLIFVVAILPLLLCIQSRTLLTVVLFVCRGMVAGVFQVAYVYTPEVYPTHLRAIGLGCCGGVSRFGAMITPIVAQVLVTVSVRYTALVYAGVASLAAVSALLLPIETGGRDME